MRKSILLSSLLFLLPACAHKTNPNPAQATFVQGKATVLQIDHTLGMALLKINGKQTRAYWDTEYAVPQDGAIANSGPFQTPVGNYREPVTQRIDIPAKPGDTILYRGMQTHDEILLRAVQVVTD
jgi:hypothetical protein